MRPGHAPAARSAASAAAPVPALRPQCHCGDCAACRARRASAGPALPPQVHEVLQSPGRPLDAPERRAMEARFGHDFGRVRLHDDERAADSARQVSARAYTVGEHVVFGARPSADAAGQRLLAHELAHVVQQRQPGAAPVEAGRREAEARGAERSLAGGGAMPALSAGGPVLARDPVPGSSGASGAPGAAAADPATEAAAGADRAELACDFDTLCRLSLRLPGVVTPGRVQRAFAVCHPEVSPLRLVSGNPCLTPNYGLSPLGTTPPAGGGPRRAPGGPGTAGGPSPASSGGGLSLPSTTLRFALGPVAVTANLPASVALRLPVPFQGAQQVVFALNASPSEFSFSVTVNAVPHVRIIASASATTAGRGSAGLTIETTRTTCRAVDPETARSTLTAAGQRLHDAIQALENPPAPAADASDLERTFAPAARYADVVSAAASLQSAIERVRAPCREVPVASFNLGVQGPLGTPDPSAPPQPSYVGGSLRLHF